MLKASHAYLPTRAREEGRQGAPQVVPHGVQADPGGSRETSSNLEKLIAVKIRDVIKLIECDGWYLVRTRGDHRQYKHASKRGLVTVSGHPNNDLAPGTLNSVLKQAGLKG